MVAFSMQCAFRLICVVAALVAAVKGVSAESLQGIHDRMTLNIDKDQISVSGVSAGGWMANQIHVAHSTKIVGAGILAAGPYHCAGGPSFFCDWTWYALLRPHDACQGLHICSSVAKEYFGFPHYYFGPPDYEESIQSMKREVRGQTIDPIGGFKGDRVWLFTGETDRMVPQDVVDQLRRFYGALFAHAEVQNSPDSIRYLDRLGPVAGAQRLEAEHAMVIHVPGDTQRCDVFSQPFINDCNFDAAGELLRHIYHPRVPGEAELAEPEHGDWVAGNLLEFDQTKHFDVADDSLSMHPIAHVYVPKSCQDGASCRLHVALHGCDQNQEAVDNDDCVQQGKCPRLYFFRDSGYNEWAEKNNIVLLYPQNMPWGDPTSPEKNPHACWDWWGYTGENYFRRSAKQIQAISDMINTLVGEDLLPMQ